MISKTIKGFINNTNVCLTNGKFKTFNYMDYFDNDNPEQKEFNFDFQEWVKIDLTHFKEIINFLYKAGYESFKIKIDDNKLKLFYNPKGDLLSSFNFDISLINKEGGESEGLFSVDYVYTFLRNFKKNEIKGQFINLYWGEDIPLFLDIKDLNKWCLIAPRVEDD